MRERVERKHRYAPRCYATRAFPATRHCLKRLRNDPQLSLYHVVDELNWDGHRRCAVPHTPQMSNGEAWDRSVASYEKPPTWYIDTQTSNGTRANMVPSPPPPAPGTNTHTELRLPRTVCT
jgi:hypothetical protein